MVKVKSFFKKVGLWFKNHAPSKRRLIQVYAALLYNAQIKGFFTGRIYKGDTKNLCVPGMNCYSCPGAVASCPLGALQNSLTNSGTHAPYYIIGILGLLGLMLARTVCGFLCPLGLGQELLHKIKTPKLKKSRYTRIFSYFKYVLLVVLVIAIPLIYVGVPAFCKYVCPAGTFEGALGLLAHPDNADYFGMLGFLFSWKFILLVAFIVLSIFIYRFFCRFICPLGAIYGFFNKIALIGVKLDTDKCVDCGLCISTCQMDIKHVGDHECINCGACIPVCPTKAISWKGSQIFLKLTTAGIAQEQEEKSVPLAEIAASGTVQTEEAEAERELAISTAEQKIKKRGFWLQFAAWALAIVVLVCALVFYNLPSPPVTASALSVGDKLPNEITLSVYESDGKVDDTFSTSGAEGKPLVVNFWYTTCGPCIAEMPHFNTVKEEFGDGVYIVAVHIADGTSPEEVQDRIDELGWRDYSIMFAQDTAETDLFTLLGGKDACPVTTVINTEGVVTMINQGPVSADELRSAIQEAKQLT